MTLMPNEFIRRFLLRVRAFCQRGFIAIHHYGLLASGRRHATQQPLRNKSFLSSGSLTKISPLSEAA
jgi:hypothetical protein